MSEMCPINVCYKKGDRHILPSWKMSQSPFFTIISVRIQSENGKYPLFFRPKWDEIGKRQNIILFILNKLAKFT